MVQLRLSASSGGARGLIPGALLVLAQACSPAAAPPAPGPVPAASGAPIYGAAASGFEGGLTGKFHSKRFDAWLQLPDGKNWRIDDHRGSWLVATHAPSSSSLGLRIYIEDSAINHSRCEARARERDPSLPPESPSQLVEAREQDVIKGWDARSLVQVSVQNRGQPGQVVEGHQLVFAALVRKCLVLHLATRAAGPGAEAAVGARLGELSELVRTLRVDDDLAGPSREPPAAGR
jgi:hypothetical protein